MTAPTEFWTCPACDTVHTSERDAVECHPVYHAWTCGSCGKVWEESRTVAEVCCTGDDDQIGLPPMSDGLHITDAQLAKVADECRKVLLDTDPYADARERRLGWLDGVQFALGIEPYSFGHWVLEHRTPEDDL